MDLSMTREEEQNQIIQDAIRNHKINKPTIKHNNCDSELIESILG
jgi:hypothetical protein